MKKKWPQGFICPFTGEIFHNIQTCMFIYNRSQVSVYRTIGPLVLFSLYICNVRMAINVVKSLMLIKLFVFVFYKHK